VPDNAVGKRPKNKYDSTLHSKQRIFLSIDIIDSTKHKSSLIGKKTNPNVWAVGFAEFLSEVVVVYQRKLIEVINKHCRKTCENPCVPELGKEGQSRHTVNVWKYIGDEVVLVAELTCKNYHATMHVLALAETIKELEKSSKNKSRDARNKNIKLRFKGTAWVAGFPVANIELNLPGPSVGQTVKDFLGPSMDLGFRLSKFASDDRLIISASLAHLIVKAPALSEPIMYKGKNDEYHLPLCFGGQVEAKGIRDGKHPLIWYSVNKTAESELCRVDSGELQTFLDKITLKDLVVPPFIPGTSKVDSKYYKKYQEAIEAQKQIPGSIFYPKGKLPATYSTKNGNTNAPVLKTEKIVELISMNYKHKSPKGTFSSRKKR